MTGRGGVSLGGSTPPEKLASESAKKQKAKVNKNILAIYKNN